MPPILSSTKVLVVENEQFIGDLLNVPVKRIVLVPLISLLALGFAARVFAQGVGSVRGTVTDKKGAPVVGVDVAQHHQLTIFLDNLSALVLQGSPKVLYSTD
jgi:hypothetical protein